LIRITKILGVLFTAAFLSSCVDENTASNKIILAKVNDVELSRSEVLHNLPDNLSPNDSTAFVKTYIDQWVQEQVVYQKALEVLPEESKDVDMQLEKYRRSLLIFTYEQLYIQDRLDTVVSIAEIEEFYNNNLEDFVLRDYIVKVVYAKYTDVTPDLDKVKSWYKLKMEDDWINLQSHANLYGVKFYNDTTHWIFFDDVLKEIPLTDINKGSFIRNKKSITFEEEGKVYFLNIIDSRLQDDVSPLEFEKDKIKGILLNIRMNELRKKLKTELYNDAQKAQIINIYK
jgi:hypothetical protein